VVINLDWVGMLWLGVPWGGLGLLLALHLPGIQGLL
jgi:hypothetical protein